MNLMEKYAKEATALSIEQYCPPRCFELAGKRFQFAIDNGEQTGEAVLDFTDERNLNWSICGDTELRPAEYECRKGDDYTYLVTYCLELDGRKENHTWVIDIEQELVTFLRCTVGEISIGPISLRATSASAISLFPERSIPTEEGTALPTMFSEQA